jgi:hypothetical protein
MKTILRIATIEVIPIEQGSCYNRQVYQLNRPNSFGITHIIEQYDDVSDDPDYLLGTLDPNGKLIQEFRGVGDPVPKGLFSCGGVTFDVELY